jgi:hypothetical protein
VERRLPIPRSVSSGLRAIRRLLLLRDGVLFIPLAALLASAIRLRGVSCGHDFDFHTISWLEVQHSWAQGVLYPHWAQIPNWTAGEPRFVFYPPISWILGALLGYVFAWPWVPAVFVFLCFAATGLTTRLLAREFLPGPNATLAGAIAAVTPYGLFTAYERSAFAELAATSLIPLLLLFAWRNPADSSSKALFPLPSSLVPVSLTLAAIWLTNAPAGVMASYLLAFAALSAAILERQWWPVKRAVLGAPLGIGLAAFYLVPAAWEQKWIDIRQALDVGMRVQDSWLFAHHAGADMEFHDQVLQQASALFVFTVALALVAFLGSVLRKQLPAANRRYWIPLALLIPGLFFLQLAMSAPLWTLLPKLQFLQFPWRWLMVLGLPYSIFLAAVTPLAAATPLAAVTPFARLRPRILSSLFWIVALAGIVWFGSTHFFQECGDEDVVDNQSAIGMAGAGVQGTDEYAPAGGDDSLIPSGLPDGCLVSDPKQVLGETAEGMAPVWYSEQGSCDDTFTADKWQNEDKVLDVESDHDGYLVLRLLRYPAWRITENGAPVSAQGNREDGLIVIPVPQGTVNVEVRWTNQTSVTPDVRWGRAISLLSLFTLVAAWVLDYDSRRRAKSRP